MKASHASTYNRLDGRTELMQANDMGPGRYEDSIVTLAA